MHLNSFWWGSNVGDYLFPGYTINTVLALVATCISLVAVAFVFEWFKLLQAKQRQSELFLRSRQLRNLCPNENVTLLREINLPVVITLKDRLALYFWDIFLWLCTINISYFMMLAVMIFNGWFLISVLIGGGLGYFLFGQSFTKLNLQNCEVIRETYCLLNCGEEIEGHRNGETTPALASSSSVVTNNCHSKTTVSVHHERDSGSE